MIKINDLCVSYQENVALSHISATIDAGDLVAIVGPNGAGKSTLLKSIMQQMTAVSGTVELGRFSLKNIAYLPQSSQIDRKFPITVTEFVSAGAWQRCSFWRIFSRNEQRLLQQALAQVDLDAMAERQISQLSGGQFQRMLFARMLLQDADILLLDEPFAGVDAQTTELLMGVIQACQQQGKTVIAVIHDLALVQRYFPTTLLVATHLIASGKTADVLTQQYLRQAGYQHFAHCAVHNIFNIPSNNTPFHHPFHHIPDNSTHDNTVTSVSANIENQAS